MKKRCNFEQNRRQARQPCLQKPLPYGNGFATTARAKGDSPLTPCAARLPGACASQQTSQWLDVGYAH